MKPIVVLRVGPDRAAVRASLRRDFVHAVKTRPTCAQWLAAHRVGVGTLHRAVTEDLFAARVDDVAGYADRVVGRYEPNARPLPGVQERLLVEEVLGDLHRKFDYFGAVADARGLADDALNLLRELKRLNVSPADFRAAVLPHAHAGFGHSRRADALAVVEEYERRLRAGHRLSLEDRLRLAAKLVTAGKPLPGGVVTDLFLDDGMLLSGPHESFVQALAARAERVWIGLAEYAQPSDWTRHQVERWQRAFPDHTIEAVAPEERPTGLRHLSTTLFSHTAARSSVAAGLTLIEAAGPIGEADLIARHVQQARREGTPAERIVVVLRGVESHADLYAEAFAAYGIAIRFERLPALGRVPALQMLHRAVFLAEDGFPFAGVGAMLRSTLWKPAWACDDATLATDCEALLRALGGGRGRDATLRAVRRWSAGPPTPLEDEETERERWRRRSELAQRCEEFLTQFYALWDDLPTSARPERYADWLFRFVETIGFLPAIEDDPAWLRFRDALTRWTKDGPPADAPRVMNRLGFRRLFMGLLAAVESPQTQPFLGAVRCVTPETALHLDVDHLFVAGLEEGTFPRLDPPSSLLTDDDRSRLKLPFAKPEDRLGREAYVFAALISVPRQSLVLSRPGVDVKGQPLLPCTFLRSVEECFVAGVIPRVVRRMVAEAFRDPPRTPAQVRVRLAARAAARSPMMFEAGLSADMQAHLERVAAVAQARFHDRVHGKFDGLLDRPTVQATIAARFGPSYRFSPTALEEYVACPYKFFLHQVLRLEPLEEPSDAIEQTRRGSAYHRALARIHANPVSAVPDDFGTQLHEQLRLAVAEYADRVSEPAAKVLWELELERLAPSAVRYPKHWEKFLTQHGTYDARKVWPTFVELDFGLPPKGIAEPLTLGPPGAEVRIGGRIDRIDVADLGDELRFWIIDYKTGRAANYTGEALLNMETLQLSLYARAVEKLAFPGRIARPGGVAYWLVAEGGPKVVLKQAMTAEAWPAFAERLEAWAVTIVEQIRAGRFPLTPRRETTCHHCDYAAVCRISQSRAVAKPGPLSLPLVDAPAISAKPKRPGKPARSDSQE